LTGSFAVGDIAVKIERHFPCSPASGFSLIDPIYYNNDNIKYP
jgi:hypothetical protein